MERARGHRDLGRECRVSSLFVTRRHSRPRSKQPGVGDQKLGCLAGRGEPEVQLLSGDLSGQQQPFLEKSGQERMSCTALVVI